MSAKVKECQKKPKTTYQTLYDAVKKRFSDLTPSQQQVKTNQIWDDVKEQTKDRAERQAIVDAKTKIWAEETTRRKNQYRSIHLQVAKKNQAVDIGNNLEKERIHSNPSQNIPQNPPDDEKSHQSVTRRPVQATFQDEISSLENKLDGLKTTRDSGLGTEEIDKAVQDLQSKLIAAEKTLKSKQLDVERQQKSRAKKRQMYDDLAEIPEAAAIMKFVKKSTPGRPKVEDQLGYEDLDEVIIQLALQGSGADDRRQSEIVRTCNTLLKLHEFVEKKGYSLSKSALYLRLIPRRCNTKEGKVHRKTVPVKLIRAQASEHKRHIDTEFAKTSINNLQCLASLLGPFEVLIISQDDKARVPLGVTAANKQCAILMHMEYKVSLPDHDFVVGPRHKLIPSVDAVMVIKENGMGDPSAVTYSGPTHIFVRSGKHSSSTAASHANDLDKILTEEPLCRTADDLVKPIIISWVDGGPDENPRYGKNKKFALDRFIRYNADAVYVGTNAPGRSCYNPVKRRMAPLPHELAGVILPYDSFGNHLDSQGRTIDLDLEKKNFKKAGKVLCEIWNPLVVDGHAVKSQYVENEVFRDIEDEIDPLWYAEHVRESQYLLQIVKCKSESCCGPRRSKLWSILPTGFLPVPTKIKQNQITDANDPTGKFMPLLVQLSVDIKHQVPEFKQVPYDIHCPSVVSQLPSRVCKSCGLYFASKKSLATHVKGCHGKTSGGESKVRPIRVLARRKDETLCVLHDDAGGPNVEWIDTQDLDNPEIQIEKPLEDATMPFIYNLKDWVHSPWTEDR